MELRAVVCLLVLLSLPVEIHCRDASGFGCGGNNCTEISSSNLCRGLPGRGTTHFSSPRFPADTPITEDSIQNGFFALSVLRSQINAPIACTQMFQYIICLLGFPPCDTTTHLPMLLCEETCLAFDKLISYGVCAEVINGVRGTALRDGVFFPESMVILPFFESFNCSNPATYGYNDTSFTECSNVSCTNLFDPETQDDVLSQAAFVECAESTSSACQTIYPVDYDIMIPSRVEHDVFSVVTNISSSLDDFCTNVLEVMACSFLHPPCTEEGAQMLICDDQCSTIEGIWERCKFRTEVLNSTSSDPFVQYLQSFNCSDSTTYLIQGVPTNDTHCIPLAEFFGSTDSENQSDFSSLPIVLGTVLPLIGVLLCSVIIVITSFGIYKLKKSKVTGKHHSFLMNRRVNAADGSGLATAFRLIINPGDLDHLPYALDPTPRNQSVLSEVPDNPAATKLSSADRETYESLFKELVVHYHNLKIIESIGQGAFGKVYAGYMITENMARLDTKVAIKTLKDVHSEERLQEFLAESLLMKDFHHPHVLGLLGVCFDAPDGSPYIVLPYMANGSLKKYLTESRVHPTNVDTYPLGLKLSTLTKMCLDIVKGMEYLSEHKFVHRDLAARNCMLNEDFCVLVGDFGLARDIYSANYYRSTGQTRLPVKWMPPETINDGISNERTDVWSYGVTCWEVFSLGRTPYPGIENHQILDHITSGKRLKKPSLCPEKLYGLIQQCWDYIPEERPTFKEVHSSLKEYWDEEHLYEVQSYPLNVI